VIGGVIGLTAYALWPTWSARSTGPLLSRLVDAQHAYMRTVMGALVGGRRPDPATLRDNARVARAVFTDADALVALSRTEPHHDDADVGRLRRRSERCGRLVYALHALRLELSPESEPLARPELVPLSDVLTGTDHALARVARRRRLDDPATAATCAAPGAVENGRRAAAPRAR